jgi:phage-related protein
MGKFVILCHAFAKKSQEVPLKEINLAEERKRDYFRRKE